MFRVFPIQNLAVGWDGVSFIGEPYHFGKHIKMLLGYVALLVKVVRQVVEFERLLVAGTDRFPVFHSNRDALAVFPVKIPSTKLVP